ncbi:MAG: CvpA family protein [Acutalibacteraceae bacterium]|nr:CvpA family protein [Clostridia bacterium]MEE1329642.1 CvpA family protein [Acutalibacteraceae bacterium]
MSIILDICVVVLIIAIVLLSAKRGFARAAVELLGFIAAVFISLTISTPLSNITYDKIIEPSVVRSVSEITGASAGETADKVWDALPSALKNYSGKIGISKENLDKSISEDLASGVEDTAKGLSQNAVKPIAVRFISLIYSAVIFSVLVFVVKILAKYINKLFSFSVAGSLNRLLGGIIGIPKGIIIAALICTVISIIISFTDNGFLIFTKDAVGNSWFFKHLTTKLF